MKNSYKEKIAIQECVEQLKLGKLPPWKVEEEIATNIGILPPDNYSIAALCRQKFIEKETGEKFEFIRISEKPYKIHYQCERDNIFWELDALDSKLTCTICGSPLKSLGKYSPLVNNYIGGSEDYYSYAGRIKVKGDVEKEFTNLLIYGTGLGPIGVTRGCYIINTFGGAEVKVSEFGRAARCLGYIFKKEQLRKKALSTIEALLPELKIGMNKKMSEFGGRISFVEFLEVENQRGFILYVDFASDFVNFRGHGAISGAVGYAKKLIEVQFQKIGIEYELSVIAQGYDGDLKPSPRNKRGRYASAQVKVPMQDIEQFIGIDAEKLLSFVELDCTGAQKLGCQFYSGMGGEIIPAIYKAAKVNPQSCLVSSFQSIYARAEKGDLIYGVELPNIEVGTVSSREGFISPGGREALRIMGIKTAREFAASVAAQVLAGEFNLAIEISREKLYK
ncbi:MAG: hypothetical protein ACETWK_14160 [Candidatus Aminicenantaceae bacterium]